MRSLSRFGSQSDDSPRLAILGELSRVKPDAVSDWHGVPARTRYVELWRRSWRTYLLHQGPIEQCTMTRVRISTTVVGYSKKLGDRERASLIQQLTMPSLYCLSNIALP
jgi:hypothetical protein